MYLSQLPNVFVQNSNTISAKKKSCLMFGHTINNSITFQNSHIDILMYDVAEFNTFHVPLVFLHCVF